MLTLFALSVSLWRLHIETEMQVDGISVVGLIAFCKYSCAGWRWDAPQHVAWSFPSQPPQQIAFIILSVQSQ